MSVFRLGFRRVPLVTLGTARERKEVRRPHSLRLLGSGSPHLPAAADIGHDLTRTLVVTRENTGHAAPAPVARAWDLPGGHWRLWASALTREVRP